MDFALSEEAQMIVDMAGQFADRHLVDHMRLHEEQGALPDAVQRAFNEAGLSMLGTIERDCELDIPWSARSKVIQRIAQADGAATLALWTQAWLPHAAQMLGAQNTDGLGYLHLVPSIETMSWPLPCIPSAGADRVFILDDAGNWGIAVVQATTVRALGLAAASPAQCHLEDWAERGEAQPQQAARARAITRLWGASILCGIARAALAYTCTYVQERVAFGKPLSHHQGVAFIVADMTMRTEGMDWLTTRAAWATEAGDMRAANDAWLEAIEASLWITDNAVQLLGGHGYTQDHPVEKWMRDARALTLLWGGVDLAERDARSMWEA